MEDAALIRQAREERDRAMRVADEKQAAFRRVVLDVVSRSGVNAAAKIAGVRPNTITDWKKQAQ